MIRRLFMVLGSELSSLAIGFKIVCATFLLQDPVVNAATLRYATGTKTA